VFVHPDAYGESWIDRLVVALARWFDSAWGRVWSRR
jgi:hypothetical protein